MKNPKLAKLQNLRKQLYKWKDTLNYYSKIYKADGLIDSEEQANLTKMQTAIDEIEKAIDEKESKLSFGEKVKNKVTAAGDAITEAVDDIGDFINKRTDAIPHETSNTTEASTENSDTEETTNTTEDTTTSPTDTTENTDGQQNETEQTEEEEETSSDTSDDTTTDEADPVLSPTSNIKGSVGAGGDNNPQDVVTVRTLLNKFGNSLEIVETNDTQLEEAIKQFQRDYRGSSRPDGRVDANGKTWGALVGIGRIQGQLASIAQEYDLEPAVILAIQSVESGGNGFFSDGRPKILFEGHIFWRELRKKGINPEQHRPGNENIVYPSWDKTQYHGGTAEYDRLDKAKAIDEEAALKSASWGEFQIMGFNHAVSGYPDVFSFVEAMHTAGKAQLGSLMGYLKGNNLLRHVRGSNKNWAKLAEGYNGPGYAANQYDVKMAKAYERFAKIY